MTDEEKEDKYKALLEEKGSLNDNKQKKRDKKRNLLDRLDDVDQMPEEELGGENKCDDIIQKRQRVEE